MLEQAVHPYVWCTYLSEQGKRGLLGPPPEHWICLDLGLSQDLHKRAAHVGPELNYGSNTKPGSASCPLVSRVQSAPRAACRISSASVQHKHAEVRKAADKPKLTPAQKLQRARPEKIKYLPDKDATHYQT